ncbi:MAG: hypothetical protein PHN44_03720 [Candidatus Marinimicrobia bacterium]|nr:hypothetical protein [Candidatus Neomarinimicrobiota bacterium]MDD5539325.1 hypothetical protein [Candidatus Neomarinimicrobiota bacterium]
MPLAKERLKERNRRVRNRYFELKAGKLPDGATWETKKLLKRLADEFLLSERTIHNILFTQYYDK